MKCPLGHAKECSEVYKCITIGELQCADIGSGMTIEEWIRVFDEKS